MAKAVTQARGKVSGCSYDLPMPSGVTIDKAQVNVTLTTDGNSQSLFRRQDPNNPCTMTGCWDYSPDGSKVQLIGAACTAATLAAKIDVKITAGCQTIIG